MQRDESPTMETGLEQITDKADLAAATKAAAALSGAAGSCSAVKQCPTSVAREIRTLRSVGVGGGHPPPTTRWAVSNGRPYRERYRSGPH